MFRLELAMEGHMTSTSGKYSVQDSGVGANAVGYVGVIVFSVVFIALSLVQLYATVVLWPPELAEDAATTDSTIKFLWWSFTITREQHFLLLVAVLGGLGAMAHVMRSFFKYVGERQLIWSWMVSYFVIPFLGAVVALITYIVLRAGLLGQSTEEGNTWGFAAIAVLVGLFSAQATSKLKDIFETILTPANKGGDPIKGAPTPKAPTIVSFDPPSGPEETRVELGGTGLEAVTSVMFGGDIEEPQLGMRSNEDAGHKVPPGAELGRCE